MKRVDPFPGLLQAFFYEWMVQQRNASVHTVRSYRDTWRLFLKFVAQRRERHVVELVLSDFTATEVSAFLNYTEEERKDTIGTRNCRLAALRSFFDFTAGRQPSAIAQCVEILHIPTKRAPVRAPSYLEADEVKAILAQPDRSTIEGQRDHALLSFLYNTGSRIQEALEVCPRAIRFDSPACVRLYGKECHSYCISLRRRQGTTGTHTCRQAYDPAFSLADVRLAVRTGIDLGPYTDAHGAGRVKPMSEPFPV